MGKVVSASEFDIRFAKLIEEIVNDGESVMIVHEGRAVAELTAMPRIEASVDTPYSVIGMLRSPGYSSDWDHEAPATDPSDWEVLSNDDLPPRP